MSEQDKKEQELVGQLVKLQAELQLVTPIELAKEVNVPPQMIYQYIRDNRIAVVRMGGHPKITRRVADEWIANRAAKRAQKQGAKAG